MKVNRLENMMNQKNSDIKQLIEVCTAIKNEITAVKHKTDITSTNTTKMRQLLDDLTIQSKESGGRGLKVMTNNNWGWA